MLIRTGFFPVCLLAFFAPHLFSLFLGKPWLNAGYFAMVIAPSVAFAFAYSPMSALFSILGLQRVMLLFESSQFFLRLLAFWLGAKLGGPLLSAALFWGVYFLFSFIKMSYLLGVLNIPYIVTFKKTSFVLFEAIALLALPFIFRLNDLSLITQVTSSLFAVFVFIFRLHSSLFFENQ
jgi:O-antigen/teichoic acid export membrane protein